MKALLAIGVVVLAIASVGWPVGSASRMTRPDRRSLRSGRDAGGATAYWDTQWTIAPPKGGVGVIVGAAVCGDEAFLLDRQLAVVHRVDLTQGAIVGDIGAGPGWTGLHEVAGLTADCDRQMLYVTDKSGVIVFDVASEQVVGRFAKPETFVNSVGSAALDPVANVLYVPGLWPATANDWLRKPVDRMFEGDRLGYRLDLATGQSSPMVSPVERGCWSLGPNCLYATLDAIQGHAGGFLAAHVVGMSVGVYDAAYRLVRTVDVRSRLFLENGVRNGSQRIAEMVAWNADNSVIRDVYAFGDTIVAVHSSNRSRGWKPGRPIDFDVFMNVHGIDGTSVASDVRLPDLPVGRDATSIYVVDYGLGGRRRIGRGPISLVRIPVDWQ